MLNRLIKVLLCFLGLLVVAFGPQAPQIFVACVPKAGVVVDPNTGQTVSGAAVVETSYFASPAHSFLRAYEGPVFRVVVRTDSHGRYALPGSWQFAEVGFPGGGARLHSNVVAVKPGYIDPDDRVTMVYDVYGRRIYELKSVSTAPRIANVGVFGLTLTPLNLETYDFTLKDKAMYYAGLLSWRSFKGEEPNASPLRDYLRTYVFDGFCEMPPDERLDLSTVSSVIDFTRNPWQSHGLGQTLEPDFYGRSIQLRPTMSAGNLCKIIREAAQ